MLDHALKIFAREQLEKITVVMAPHINKQDRKKLLDDYRRIIDGERDSSSATIEADRKRLKALLFKKK